MLIKDNFYNDGKSDLLYLGLRNHGASRPVQGARFLDYKIESDKEKIDIFDIPPEVKFLYDATHPEILRKSRVYREALTSKDKGFIELKKLYLNALGFRKIIREIKLK